MSDPTKRAKASVEPEPKKLTPEWYSWRARKAARARWAKEEDPSAATKPARDAYLARLEREADPDNELSSEERTRRAEAARRAHLASIAEASVAARTQERARS